MGTAGGVVGAPLPAHVCELVPRAGDTLGRFGGDQFVVVCDDCALQEAVVLAGRLLALLVGSPVRIGADEVSVSASIGIAHNDGDGAPEELLRNAGAAMALAKRAGGNTFEFYHRQAREPVRAREGLLCARPIHRTVRGDRADRTDRCVGLHEACSQLRFWPKDVAATINVSAVQVYRGDLEAVVGAALSDTGCDPRR